MARATFEAWVPEEYSGAVISKIRQGSAVEDLARVEPMGTDTKHVPRSGGVAFVGAVSKGAAYTEDGSTNDEVLLTARKMGVVVRVADEDLKDITTGASVIQTKQLDWARSQAIGFDNATLGVTAAENGTTVPFTSLYKALTTTNAATGYTANANVVTSATATALTYVNISDTFAKVEQGAFWEDGAMCVIAHPYFRAGFRGILDSAGRPIFLENQQSVNGPADTLWGMPVRWSLGAKTHATATDSPTGDPLLFVGNRNYIIKGDRSGPEYMLAGADSGPAFLTDEALLKMRIRRGFAVANENAWAVLRDTA
jgi:HK97 family phage major capsid protein